MTFNTVIISFEDEEEMKRCIENCGVSVWEENKDELWVEFDVSGFEPSDFEKYFGNI